MHMTDLDTGHGRIVAQRCLVLPAAGIVSEADWPACAVIARIDSLSQIKSKTSELVPRDYLRSRNLAPSVLAEAVRSHWAIENPLHWVLDVTRREDASTIRKDCAPENLFCSRKSSSTSCVPILLDAKKPAFASDENAPPGMMVCGLNCSASIPYDVRVRKPWDSVRELILCALRLAKDENDPGRWSCRCPVRPRYA